MTDACFEGKPKIDLAEFQSIIENKASDMLLTVMNIIRSKLPCSENFYHYQKDFEAQMKEKDGGSEKKKTIKVASPTMRSISPGASGRGGPERAEPGSMFSKKGGEESKIQMNQLDKEDKMKKRREMALKQKAAQTGACPDSPGATAPGTEFVRLDNQTTQNTAAGGFASPTAFLTGAAVERGSEESKKEAVSFEGEMMRKAKENKLKRYWYCLLEKELYVYKHKDDATHKTMVNLIGVFIKDEPEEVLDKKNSLFPFTIIFPNKQRTFYLQKKEDRDMWMTMIKQAIGYANLFDFYEVKEAVGKGKFGTVKLGIHKKTGKKVAVKIMKKKQMTVQDIELQMREIEILKICQHPNIIRLLDVFENQDYIYIVMEYLKGGDLFNYLESRDFTITQDRAREMSHEIATAVYYLHNYGITHRDLKPENILMTSTDDDAHPKLVDFGLSKIIGPGETCNDPFGTLSYVAPEVLLQKPYDKSVDLWSVGVIVYLLLSGTLPFDDDDDREIARQTIHDPVDFSYHVWKKIPDEAKDLIKVRLILLI